MGRPTGQTRAAVARMREEDPEVTAAEMAVALGVERERVRQILVALGLPTTTSRSDSLRGSYSGRRKRGPRAKWSP